MFAANAQSASRSTTRTDEEAEIDSPVSVSSYLSSIKQACDSSPMSARTDEEGEIDSPVSVSSYLSSTKQAFDSSPMNVVNTVTIFFAKRTMQQSARRCRTMSISLGVPSL
ncbi:unnamed protein product [Phytophthora lilii]|uniref:Unnamed protein product n=1 Tax=Phytophthora lilii TaxID=2077276 RepID=A0A9W6YJA3_9STRA|nr:unnamed protein product [Phytophthora lilii]